MLLKVFSNCNDSDSSWTEMVLCRYEGFWIKTLPEIAVASLPFIANLITQRLQFLQILCQK